MVSVFGLRFWGCVFGVIVLGLYMGLCFWS